MPDALDKAIRQAADVLHEEARQQIVRTKHRHQKLAKAAVDFDTMMERILFHYPLPKREKHLELSDEKFAIQFRKATAHRIQLCLTTILRLSHHTDDPRDGDWDQSGGPFLD